jgi:hypothetical protein
MKNFLLLGFNLLLAVAIACQPVGQSMDNPMLKPGDEVNDMLITTGAAKVPPLWAFCPPSPVNDAVRAVDCRVPSLPRLSIGHTFRLADPVLQTLDWSALTWELSVDGQMVDLEAFGTYDFAVPDLAPHPSPLREIFRQFKAWDVILTNLMPGAHTLHGIAYSQAVTYTWTVNFTVEAPRSP